MITNLHIKNIGIIDDIEIDLGKALNVLTGETGAGKKLNNRFKYNIWWKIFKRNDKKRRNKLFCRSCPI